MELKSCINKFKINFFGNPWVARILELIRYLGAGAIAWKFWVSENFFSKQSPLLIFKSFWGWEKNTFNSLLDMILILALASTIIFIYLYLLGKLIKWLTELKFNLQEQVEVLKGNYKSAEKNYSVKIEKLKKVGYYNSPYIYLKGVLTLKDSQGKIKKINSSCYSLNNTFDSYLQEANINTTFQEKKFFPSRAIIFLLLLVLNGVFAIRVYQKSISLEKESSRALTLKEILSSATSGRLKAQREAELKVKKEAKELEANISRGSIVSPNKIIISKNDIGGNLKAKEVSLLNAKIIADKNAGSSTPYNPFNMLLFGPPGTGKTMLAKLIAKESGSYFVNLTGDRFKGSDAGKRLRECLDSASEAVIKLAEKEGKKADNIHCVVLIDEVDKCTAEKMEMSDYMDGFAGSFLLPILDGVEKGKKGVKFVFVFTTNFPERLNSALFRSGRIDEQLCVFYPSPEELSDIIKKNLSIFFDKNEPLYPELFDSNSSTKSAFISRFGTTILKEMLSEKYAVLLKEVTEDEISKKLIDRAGIEKISLFSGADVERVIRESPNATLQRKEKGGSQSLIEEDFINSIQKTFENMAGRGLSFGKFINQMLAKYIKISDITQKRRPRRHHKDPEQA